MTTTTLQFASASVSDKGLSEKRPVNEDSYLELVERGLFAVADGVGGAQAGDVASQMAMEVLYEAFSHPQPNVDTEELMEMAIQRANQAIHQMAHELPQLDMMATTIVTLHLTENIATIGHVGDSRLYRLDTRGNLFRETQDHSVVEEEVRAGRMTSAQAASHPSRNIISRALGAEDTVEVDMKTIMFEPGTMFMLCSDGITRHVQDHEIRELLRSNALPVDICSELKNLCYSRGAEDNLTAVVIRVEGDAEGSFFDDEKTLAAVRDTNTVTTENAFSAPSNGSNQDFPSPQTITEEFSQSDHDARTAPLEPIPVMDAPQIRDFDDTVADESDGGLTIQSKIDNERLREKINSAEPAPAYEPIEPERKGSSLGKLLTNLLLLLIGAAIGSALLYAYLQNQPQTSQNAPVTQPMTQQTAPQQQITVPSDMTQAEVTEYRSFERIRRTIDDNPSASPNAASPQTAADFYLRGRAYLQTGRYEDALQALRTAQEMLPDVRDVDVETLRVDVAIAQAALAAMANNASGEKMLGDLVNEKKGSGSAPQPPAP